MSFILELLLNQLFIRTLCAGILTSLCAAALGVILMFDRRTLLGGGIGGVGFAAASLSLALGLPVIYISLPAAFLAALLLTPAKRRSCAEDEAASGTASAAAFSAGVIIIVLSGGFDIERLALMFGDLRAVTDADVLTAAVFAAVSLLLLMFFRNRIFLAVFDEPYAKACGISPASLRLLAALLTAVTVLIGMKSVGSLMIPSIIILPAMTARRFARGFRRTIIASCIISGFCFICGAVVSLLLEIPTGAAVACVNAAVLLIVSLLCRADNGGDTIFL